MSKNNRRATFLITLGVIALFLSVGVLIVGGIMINMTAWWHQRTPNVSDYINLGAVMIFPITVSFAAILTGARNSGR